MKPSTKFEHQIRRIHELIEQEGSIITWDDRIPDPDNTEQLRQIDISIKRDDKLTLVECRLHNKKQDVKWIEELIGRRLSLKADAVIAVSASGFTEGAVLKAKSYGIILRDFLTLTLEEIKQWGHSTEVTLQFYKYENVCLGFKIPSRSIPMQIVNDIYDYFTINCDQFYELFNLISQKVDEKELKTKIAHIKVDANVKKPFLVNSFTISEITLEADITAIENKLSTPSVVVYNNSVSPTIKGDAYLETTDDNIFEIVQTSDKVVIVMDLFSIESPPDCHFQGGGFDFGRTVQIEKLEILSPPKFHIPLSKVQFKIIL